MRRLRSGKRLPILYKIASRGAKWKHGTSGEAADVVKGVNKRVIVVRSPDPQVFEEAIFVLREDYAQKKNAGEVLSEAHRAAGEYLKAHGAGRRRSQGVWGAVIAAVGAIAAGIAWLTLHFSGM